MPWCVRFGFANARLCLGEKTVFSPSFGTPPRSGIWSIQCRSDLIFNFVFVVRFNVPTESALAQPPLLSFQDKLCGIASATKLCLVTQPRRSPESPNAPSGNSPRTHSVCACPKPTHARTILNFGNKKGKFSSLLQMPNTSNGVFEVFEVKSVVWLDFSVENRFSSVSDLFYTIFALKNI
jgi:hypothetical protein